MTLYEPCSGESVVWDNVVWWREHGIALSDCRTTKRTIGMNPSWKHRDEIGSVLVHKVTCSIFSDEATGSLPSSHLFHSLFLVHRGISREIGEEGNRENWASGRTEPHELCTYHHQ